MGKQSSNDNRTSNPILDEVYKPRAKALSHVLSDLCTDEPVLNESELFSIRALVSYAAHEQSVSEDVIRAMVATKFNSEGIDRIMSRDYDAAVQYLVDLNPKANIN